MTAASRMRDARRVVAIGALTCAFGAAASLIGCGGSQHADAEAAEARPAPPAGDPRTPIERRRDAACEQLGPRITACAVADARADLAAGKIDQRQFAADTAPEIQQRNTEEFERACKKSRYSSRQVRVLEVCAHEETQCAPLLDCLGHVSDRVSGGR
jgi:hypothetical protein